MTEQERLEIIYNNFNTQATRQELLNQNVTSNDIMDLKRRGIFVTSKRGVYAINRAKLITSLGITEVQEPKELTEEEKLAILKNSFHEFATRECLELFGFSDIEIQQLHRDGMLNYTGDNKFMVNTDILNEKLKGSEVPKETTEEEKPIKKNRVFTIPENPEEHPSLDLSNNFGLDDVWIVEYLLSSEIDLPVIFEQLDYTEEEAEVACLLMARKYYANGMYKMGDIFLNKITDETAVTPFVSWLRQEIITNRHNYDEATPERKYIISPLDKKE